MSAGPGASGPAAGPATVGLAADLERLPDVPRAAAPFLFAAPLLLWLALRVWLRRREAAEARASGAAAPPGGGWLGVLAGRPYVLPLLLVLFAGCALGAWLAWR